MVRAPVSKTGCWGFESLLACQNFRVPMIKKTVAKTKEFFGEVKVEAKKVSYPTRDETMGTTAVVLVLVVVVAIYLWFVDLGLAKVMRMVLP